MGTCRPTHRVRTAFFSNEGTRVAKHLIRGNGAHRLALMALLASLAGCLPTDSALSAPLAVSAVVLSNTNCRFQTGPATLPFGTIDPTSSANATASVSIRFWCFGFPGTTYSLTAGNGLHSPGAGLRRVRNNAAPTEFMAYTLAISPASGNLPWLSVQNITISGTIVPTEFQNARTGAYSDTVVLSLEP